MDDTAPLQVLVVEDNRITAELAEFLLVQDGAEVRIAHDAVAARALIDAKPPDVILLDVQLPGVDGLTLAAELKAQPATRGIPIVAFTAYAMKGDEARMRAAGCDGYIAKPLDVRHFARTVRDYAQGHAPPPAG